MSLLKNTYLLVPPVNSKRVIRNSWQPYAMFSIWQHKLLRSSIMIRVKSLSWKDIQINTVASFWDPRISAASLRCYLTATSILPSCCYSGRSITSPCIAIELIQIRFQHTMFTNSTINSHRNGSCFGNRKAALLIFPASSRAINLPSGDLVPSFLVCIREFSEIMSKSRYVPP